MRRYETTYILRPNLGESQITEIIDRTNDIIKNDGGTIIDLNRWGLKTLAYEIKKEKQGHYIYFDYTAHGSTVEEMERIFRIDDQVLRFLTIKLADSIDQETIDNEIERIVASAAAEKLAEETEEAGEEKPAEETEEAGAEKPAEDTEQAGEETGPTVAGSSTDTDRNEE